MCGIYGYIGKNNHARDLVLTGLKSLEYRGYDSWGIASIDKNNRISIIKKTGKIGNVKFDKKVDSSMSFGHTRWATHGGVTEKNAHPHLDCTCSMALIHNGIIENYDTIKNKLQNQGHKFISETDSEVAVHLIESYYEKQGFEKAVIKAFKELKGLNAIIVLDAKLRLFAAAKNGSPLIIGSSPDGNFLASDAHAIIPHTSDLYFMEDDELVIVGEQKIKAIDLINEKEKKIEFTKVSWTLSYEEKGKLPHFMLKEIFDQEKMIEYILLNQDDYIKKYAKLITSSFGTYLVGCGTAAYACLAGTYLFSKIAKIHVNYSVASEFGYLVDFLTKKSLVIGLSQSGETIDLIDALKKAKMKGAVIASLVNVIGSTLYRMSDEKLLLNAGVEQAVVTTKAFTSKLAYLILIAFQIAGNLPEGKNVLKLALNTVKSLFKKENLESVKKIARILVNKEHVYVIGRGLSYPIALEVSLKIKEASYIHAEGFAAGELKHGVIALIEKGTPCLAIIPNDESYGDTLSGVMELKARGGFIIGIGAKNHDVFDEFIYTQDCGVASVIPNVIVGQLLGYYLAVFKKLDPDKPRNLAKSVVVK